MIDSPQTAGRTPRAPRPPLIPFPSTPPAAVLARLVRREKRFTVVTQTESGPLLAHCNNTGAMLGLVRQGARVLLTRSDNPRRRLAYTLELVEHQGFWVGVNTMTPNRLLAAAWRAGLIPELASCTFLRPEVVLGESRIDCLLTGPDGPIYVETKNVTMVEDGVALFPDAVTERGQKHLRELAALARRGVRAACFYLVQRPDGHCFGPADFIDPAFADCFYEALEAGVEAWPYRAEVGTAGIGLGERLPVVGKGNGEGASGGRGE